VSGIHSVKKDFGTGLALIKVKFLKGGNIMKKVFVVFAMALVLAGATYVYAVGPGPGPGPREGCMGYGKGASLTEEQRTQLQELRQKFHSETATLREQIWAMRQELLTLWSDSKFGADAILKKEKELRDLQDLMKDKAVQMKLEARTILTPEQLAEFGTFGGPGSGRGSGRGHGKGRGCGGGY
jgi:Spy/CpxP family protein refolding chaperone